MDLLTRPADGGFSYRVRRATVMGCMAVFASGLAGCGDGSGAHSTSLGVGGETTRPEQQQAEEPPESGVDQSSPSQTTTQETGRSNLARLHRIEARSKASDTAVSASAVLSAPKPIPKIPKYSYRKLKVSYRIEYQSGLRPVEVEIQARTPHSPARMAGKESLGPGDVHTGEKTLPFPAPNGPVEVEVILYSRLGTSLGNKNIVVMARQR
jgi:hypothetical protein